MTTMVEIEVPTGDFPLGNAVTAGTDRRVRLAHAFPAEGAVVVAYFWLPYADLVDVDRALSGDGVVDAHSIVDTVAGEAQLRVERASADGHVLQTLWDAGGLLLDASGDEKTWVVRARFDRPGDVSAFADRCTERGIAVAATESGPGWDEAALHDAGLTMVQRDTLLNALEHGYFDVPRGITLVDLASEKGVSDSAVSQRLRRGIKTLVAATLDSHAGSPRQTEEG